MLKRLVPAVLGLALIANPQVAFAVGEEAMAIAGQSSPITSDVQNQDWKLSIFDIELKSELNTTQTTTGYDGTTISNTYTDKPAAGKVFAMVKISALRQNLSAETLNVSDIRLHIGSAEIGPKEPAASFLAHHNYAGFSSDLIDKSSSGTVAFEVDASYLNSNPEGWYIS